MELMGFCCFISFFFEKKMYNMMDNLSIILARTKTTFEPCFSSSRRNIEVQ